MALPHKLKDFNLYGDSNSWQGQVKSLTTPELSRNVTSYRAGGMDAEVELDMGQQVIEFQWTIAGVLAEIYNEYGSPVHDATQRRFVGSYESDEDGTIKAVEIVVRGRDKTIGGADSSPGDDSDTQITTTCSYYKLTIDDETIIEIDGPGMVFNVRGEDRMADRRAALQL
ncbi:phage major tail tube protein [Salinisphaera sp. USBA-960]|nr:phage major tail tube protein [Salifodinibacter halophilus]NNC25295.1 phage major tail tube protein [Salifodinibacter halophilus]